MLVAALDAIATGTVDAADPRGYRGLPFNGRPINDLVIRGGQVVTGGMPPVRVDLAVNFAEPLHRVGGRVVDVGDLAEASARDTLDVEGLFLHFDPPAPAASAPAALLGAPASFTVRRGVAPGSPVVRRVEAGALAHPSHFPD
jgi:hypothetical protein